MVNNFGLKLKGVRFDRVQLFSILIFAFTIPISQYLSSRLLVLTLILSLPKISLRRAALAGSDLLLYFVLLICGLFFTQDVPLGLRVLETSLSMLAMPLIFSGLRDIRENRMQIIWFSFCGGVCLASVMVVVHAGMRYWATGNSNVMIFYELTGLLDFQPTYFAYFLVLAITCALYLLEFNESYAPSWLLRLVVIGLFAVLMLTGGRTTFISMLMIFSYFILIHLLSLDRRKNWGTFGIIIGMTIALFAISNYVYNAGTFSDSWERFDLWTSAIRANDDVFFGVGTGGGRKALNEYYIQHGLDQFAEDNMNAHNQYLQTYLSHGIVGLVALLILITRPLYLGFRANYSLAILLIFPFLIYGMTEVFLGRYQGIVFFVFLHQLLIAYLSSSKQLPISLTR